MDAYRWNSIESIMESGAVYGEDYEVSRNGLPLIYSQNDKSFMRPMTSSW